MKICVLGLGYIGLPTAAMFATHGYKVAGVDINNRIVESLNAGEVYIEELGLGALVHDAIENGNLTGKNKPEESDVFIICVPTPLARENKKADLSYVIEAAESIVPFLRKDNLVILESTVPPGTTLGVLIPILEKSGLKAGNDFYVAHCPERVLPGNILKEIVENYRMICGIDEKSSSQAKEIYKSFVKGKIIIIDSTTAEFVKLLENTYRDVNIALANEVAKISESIGVNVWDAIKLANEHPRVHLHYPGPGVGGHCIPIDPWFIYEKAPEMAKLIKTAREINNSMPHYVVNVVNSLMKKNEKKKIAVLGVTYKANVDDTRESPAIEIIRLLKEKGYTVAVHDPKTENFVYPLTTLDNAINNANCLLILVDHDDFKKLDPASVGKKMRSKIVIDTRNCIDKNMWMREGFKCRVLGESCSGVRE